MSNITQSDYLTLLARTRAKSLRPSETFESVDRESDLHQQITDECRRRGWIALHGSMAHRTHRTIAEWDFVIIADYGRTFLVEAKSKTGKLTADQQALAAWAVKLGHAPVVVQSFTEFLEAVK